MRKKLLSLFLAVTMMFAMIPSFLMVASATDVPAQVDISTIVDGGEYVAPNGTKFVVIKTAAKLNELAAANTKCNYILANDLDYGKGAVTRIPLHNGAIFDGNGYSMVGFPEINGVGGWSLFEDVTSKENTKNIKNLTIGAAGENGKVIITSLGAATTGDGSIGIGVIFDRLENAETDGSTSVLIENVKVYAEIGNAIDTYAGGFVSGFVGLTKKAALTIRGCEFNGSITRFFTSGNYTCTAGFVGKATTGSNITVENCTNNGPMTAGNGSYAGGIIGFAETASCVVAIGNCVNRGNISTRSGSSGGILGCNDTVKNAIISYCINTGNVDSSRQCGGILGVSYRSTASATVTNCVNMGKVTGTANQFGELIGRHQSTTGKSTIQDCIIIGGTSSIVGDNNSGVTKTNILADATTTTAGVTKDTIENLAATMREWFPDIVFGVDEGKITMDANAAETKFLQYRKDSTGETVDVRLLGTMNDTNLENYRNVGFTVTITQKGATIAEDIVWVNAKKMVTTKVYSSMSATVNGGIKSYSATELGAAYVYAVEILDIPTEGTFVLTVQAFSTALDGIETPDKVVTITVADGVIQ